jgi:alpha-tubulin suppressor-like RCC1 family protein
MISCGSHHTIILNEKNEIYVCGYNGFATVFDMKNIKGGKCPPKVIDNPDDEDDEENQATKSK